MVATGKLRETSARRAVRALHGRPSRPIPVALVLLALLVATVGACGPAARVGLTPTTIGVVASVEPTTGRTYAYHLSSGMIFPIDLSAADILLPDGGPGPGYLLLSGTEPSGRIWVAGFPPYRAADVPPDCFQVVATGVGVDNSIDLSIGVRLRKATSFDPGPISDERYNLDRASFCVNGNGEVLSYG